MYQLKKRMTVNDSISLKKKCEELELDNAILQGILEITKKDPSTSFRDLSNREKSQLISALQMKAHYRLQDLLKRMELSQSSYYYHRRRAQMPDYL